YRERYVALPSPHPAPLSVQAAWSAGRSEGWRVADATGEAKKEPRCSIAAPCLLALLFLDIYEDVAAFDFDLKPGYVLHGGEAQNPAIPDVEARAVARALDLVAVEFALGQRAAVMRAQVLNGVELPADVKHSDEQPVVGFDNNALARGEFVYFRNLDEVGHGESPDIELVTGWLVRRLRPASGSGR